MADLYTDLRALKMARNGGVMPPMTPIPESVHHLIDPAFVPGLGALSETMENGLRCPVRGCGVWRHSLSQHLRFQHADVGGAGTVKRALSIPATAKLVSVAETERCRAAAAQWTGRREHLATQRPAALRASRTPAARARKGRTSTETAQTMGFRNLAYRCETQMRHDLTDLHNALGRTPSAKEAEAAWGPATVYYARKVYGSWAAFVLRCDFTPRMNTQRVSREWVIESFRAYHAMHGKLPTEYAAKRWKVGPLVPSRGQVFRAMESTNWRDCMERIAARLNIYGGRYGLPESVRPKAERAAAA